MIMPNLPEPKSDLSKAYVRFRTRVLSQAPVLGFFELAAADAVGRIADAEPTSEVAEFYRRLLVSMDDPLLATDADKRAAVETLYRATTAKAFPATAAYLAQCEATSGLTANVSLLAVDLTTLREIDERAHRDKPFRKFVTLLCAKLKEVKSSPDAQRYGQFFEIYGEAVVMLRLREKRIRVRRVPEASHSMPDFECETEAGRRFFIEVKSLDVVDGVFRQNEMMLDALDNEIDLEKQRRAGKRILMTEREIAPFRKTGTDPDYDPRSLLRVIDTFREKWRKAFKASQFAQGPTFALALTDRLVLPGDRQDLAPYYFETAQDGGCVSGVLWQAAFGREGGAVLRLPDFAGKPNLEGHLTAPGIFVDPTQSFDAVGLVTFDVHCGKRVAYGLAAPSIRRDDWSADDTEEVLHDLCDAWNDERSTRAFGLSSLATANPLPHH